jgi:translation initiation factor 3 subunit B
VPREKFEKLEGVIRKIYSQIGLIKDDGLWMPIDPETQKTMGYCFIEFNTPLVILSLPLSLSPVIRRF